jgi:ribosomal protein L11 methylase PrmA
LSERTAAFVADGGSFRDRANRVYRGDSEIVRGLDADALANWKAIEAQSFFRKLMEGGRIVATSDRSVDRLQMPADNQWAGYVEHERVPFLSYPYEWSFGMLKDAALLHLDILEEAIPAGWTLKDASAYNVQFIGARPVFIDVASFTPYAAGEPWIGYRQFCMMFLYPLMLKAYRGIDYLPLLRSNLEGIDPDTANQILTGVTRFRKGVLGHVYLHSKMQARHKHRDLDEARHLTEEVDQRPAERKAGRHSQAMVMGILQGLRRTIEKLNIPGDRTTWGNYETDHSYAEASFTAKTEFVEQVVGERGRRLVWDLGCNTGTFSRIAAGNTDYVVAIDGDVQAIERLYQREKAASSATILPLVMNVANVSPAQGWRGAERKALDERGRPELVLCLALIHHIVISANIPLAEFLGWLRSLGGEVVIESVGRNDDMTRMLLRNRVDQYAELDDDNFERTVGEFFEVVRTQPLKGGTRRLYHLRPR